MTLANIFKIFGKSRTILNNRKFPRDMRAASVEISEMQTDGEWQKIVPFGEFPTHHQGGFKVTNADGQDMERNFKAGAGKVLIDYEHNSLFGDTRAAGWGHDVQWRADDGLYWKAPQFVPNAEKAISDGEYSYYSPVIQFKAKNNSGKKIGTVLHSVALTNLPFFQTEIDAIRNSQTEDNEMKFTDEQLAQLRKNHNLPEDATEEDVQTAILNSKPVDSEEPDNNEPDGDDVDGDEPEDDGAEARQNSALMDELKKINSRLDKIEDNDTRSNAEKLVDDAIGAKKITPAQRAVYVNSALQDYDGTKKVLDALKANSALPGVLSLNEPQKDDHLDEDGEWKENAREDAADEIVQGRAAEMQH